MPVIAPCLPLIAIHALLDDGPMALIGDEETMQVEVEAILHSGTVDLRDQSAGSCQCRGVKPDPIAKRLEFCWGFARMLAATAAYVDAKLRLKRR